MDYLSKEEFFDKYIGKKIDLDKWEDGRYSRGDGEYNLELEMVWCDENEDRWYLGLSIDDNNVITDIGKTRHLRLVGEDATYCKYEEIEYDDEEYDNFDLWLEDIVVE